MSPDGSYDFAVGQVGVLSGYERADGVDQLKVISSDPAVVSVSQSSFDGSAFFTPGVAAVAPGSVVVTVVGDVSGEVFSSFTVNVAAM